MNLKKISIIFLILFFNVANAEIYHDNDLNYFGEKKEKLITDKKLNRENNQNRDNVIIYNSDISVKEIHLIGKIEYKNFPKDVILYCKKLKQATLIVNQEYLLKIKKEFNINEKVNFKKVNVEFYEVPFYFSDSEDCIFNKDKSLNIYLKSKIMSEIKNYKSLNRR